MNRHLHLFEGFGVELEYMIVDANTLDIRPYADRILAEDGEAPAGAGLTAPGFSWSNELASHVIEIKTDGPVHDFNGLAEGFASEVRSIERALAPHACRLMPTAMHPWMDPHRESRLWPHGAREIYHAFDNIFDCRGHGWTNLQSVHLNLPFEGDDEFRRLHSAIRVVLPLIPALAASSPIADGRPTGILDTRLEHYRFNCARIPSITGNVVPELVRSPQEYADTILSRIYADLVPFGADGTLLQDEWTNARGAIARFNRNTIEIRLIDIQEQPAADIALLEFLVALLRGIVAEEWCSLADQEAASTGQLALQLRETTVVAEAANPMLPECARALGIHPTPHTVGDALRILFERVAPRLSPAPADRIHAMLSTGCLARRILAATGPTPDRPRLHATYRNLSDCLRNGHPFAP